ncbi:MAG: DUF4388 domain-containing protein [Myxococcota bacterium]
MNDRNPSEIQVRKRTPHHMPATFVRQGHLRTTPFDMLLRLALTSHAYGRLDLQEGKHRRQIMFLGGLPVSVRSNIDGESLLGFIHKRKLIDSQAQSEALLHRQTRAQKEFLLDNDLLSAEQLRMAELNLADATLLACLDWHSAMFRFNPIPAGAPPRQRLHINPILTIARWLQRQRLPVRLSESLEPDPVGRLLPSPLGLRHQALLDTCRVHIAGFTRALDDWRTIDSMTGFGYDDPVASYVKAAIDLGLVDVRSRLDTDESRAWLRHLVELEHQRIHHNARSPAAILEVPEDAEEHEISAAAQALTRFTHDSHFVDCDDDIRQLAHETRRAVEDALRQLLPEPPISRSANTRSIRTSGLWRTPKNRDISSQHALAHVLFLDGMTYLKLADLDEATQHFQQCHHLHPEEARYLAFLGWALYLKADDDTNIRETGRKAVLEAMHNDPDLDLTYVVLGNIYAREGQRTRAINLYRKAISLNPRNKDARKRLRRLEEEHNRG